MQIGFYFDQTRCIGCHACVIACKDWYDIQDESVNWIRLLTLESGKYPDVSVNFLVVNCHHCGSPACIQVCPVNAIKKRPEDGIVVIDSIRCSGKDFCDLCQKACSYNVPQFGSERNAKAQKCNFCLERLEQGLTPICVEACPVKALDIAPIEELEAKYGKGKVAEGFENNNVKPSVVFKSQS